MGCLKCEKPKPSYRKGLWSPDEDKRLKAYILRNGVSCWSVVPDKAGLLRNGKSCRLRWINYLRPGLKREAFSKEEEELVLKLHAILGNKWSQIATHMPGRTDNEVKNYWNSYLKRKGKQVHESDRIGTINRQKLTDSKRVNSSVSSDAECWEQVDSCRADSFQSMTTSSKESSTSTTARYLPKFLFADWLYFDRASCGIFSNSADAMSGLWHNYSSAQSEMCHSATPLRNRGKGQDILNVCGIHTACGSNQGQFEVGIPQDEFFDMFSSEELNLDNQYDFFPCL